MKQEKLNSQLYLLHKDRQDILINFIILQWFLNFDNKLYCLSGWDLNVISVHLFLALFLPSNKMQKKKIEIDFFLEIPILQLYLYCSKREGLYFYH